MIDEDTLITNTILRFERRGVPIREAALTVVKHASDGMELSPAEEAALQDALAEAAHSRRVLNMVWGSVQARRGLAGGYPVAAFREGGESGTVGG